MSLPNPSMSFTPFDVLPASDLNDLVENIEALAAGTGLNNQVITSSKLSLTTAYQGNNTSGTTASTTYTSTLSGGGTTPTVTITVGPNGIALVGFNLSMGNNAVSTISAAVAVSGSTTIAATQDLCFGYPTNVVIRGGLTHLYTGLTPGSNTFTLQYQVNSGTGTFDHREIWAVGL